MSTAGLQAQLFQLIRHKLGAHASLADEIAKALEISTDSAYRRIRGEKGLSLEELHRLCILYSLSVDALLNLQSDVIPFQGRYVDPQSFRFDAYLNSVCQQLQYMASFGERKLYYLCKDIPLFHHYQFRELAAFKYFFWHKTLLQSPQFATRRIVLHEYPEDIYRLGRKALQAYNSLDSVEIWNIESLNGTLRQVEYYHDTNAFENSRDLLTIYTSLEELFTHLEAQAAAGYKFDSSDPEQKKGGTFHFYFNEVVIGDNSLLAQLDDSRICFLTHSAINFIATRDLAFCNNQYHYFQNLMRKSTLISTVSERERSWFFHQLRHRIAARKESLSPVR